MQRSHDVGSSITRQNLESREAEPEPEAGACGPRCHAAALICTPFAPVPLQAEAQTPAKKPAATAPAAQPATPAKTAPAAKPGAAKTAPAKATAAVPQPELIVETAKGTITIKLFPDTAPKSIEHILKLVNRGFYRSQRVSRIVPGQIRGVPAIRSPAT